LDWVEKLRAPLRVPTRPEYVFSFLLVSFKYRNLF
jgi:hypothetical protein